MADRGLSPISQETGSSPPSSPSHDNNRHSSNESRVGAATSTLKGGAGDANNAHADATATSTSAAGGGATTTGTTTTTPAAKTKKPKRKKPKRKAAAIESGSNAGASTSAAPAPAASSRGGGDNNNDDVEAAISRKAAKKAKKKRDRTQPVEKEKESSKASSSGSGGAGASASASGSGGADHGATESGGGGGGGGAGGGGHGGRRTKKAKKPSTSKAQAAAIKEEADQSAAQKIANEQMRRVLEEEIYSANGSIVETDSENEDNLTYRGELVRMDRPALMGAMRKHLWMERLSGSGNVVAPKQGEEEDDDNDTRRGGGSSGGGGGRKKKKKGKKGGAGKDGGAGGDDQHRNSNMNDEPAIETSRTADAIVNPVVTANGDVVADDYDDRDGGSIFGQTTGSSNATWVECDKCKKWRRLRGVVDEKKLPSRWYCYMNKNDPERARCSAPEEEYETPHTPESAADARTRKHLRVWVRRLQCNEAYESRQPTLTRGRKRATASTCKEPYEWIRCCNQSCGKWRAILRIMDAKTSVIERTSDGEWYCVMNTWDEKTASCAAPQENLPAIACPPWVNQD